MASLVFQLQSDALDRSVRTIDLLRKAKVVAAKLDISEFIQWVNFELNGYDSLDDTPDYRHIKGSIKFRNPYHGWMPLIFEEPELERLVTLVKVGQPLGSLEDVVERSSRGSGFLTYPIPGEAQAVLSRETGVNVEFQMHIGISQAVGIFDAVRNKILDWSVELERIGVVGDGMRFSVEEKKVAHADPVINNYHIQNVGVFGDVDRSHVNSTQNVNYSQSDLSELKSIISQVVSSADQLDSSIQTKVSEAAHEALEQLNSSRPDSSRIRVLLSSIRSACEGAAGNLIAAGIVGLIARFL
ncbi:hypothetical protein T8K17_25295 [Thalassobaculum sp. OXR-137]|uniref:AbiTii domain-containing protein n=1 Tax=Thalassobaculum sp. OXR-137 TaxID=3100173 RepID=UPI002AC8ECC1|nr:hypothetical protein [Thalassobaculum sp. OXR-137]WPZ34526.1 hypothetical protein T8K17_25295 [Thalassobaculum sp. OXR-137]